MQITPNKAVNSDGKKWGQRKTGGKRGRRKTEENGDEENGDRPRLIEEMPQE